HGEADVLHDGVDEHESPLILMAHLHLVDTAELTPRFKSCLLARHALRDEFVLDQVEVQPHFFVQAPISTSAHQHFGKTTQQRAHIRFW
ncbi:MAG: hypothetical protein IT178_07050, partial [Acidobacteria bacterium]|nr:hypothetical protein [Acidobacteriota bacterium]